MKKIRLTLIIAFLGCIVTPTIVGAGGKKTYIDKFVYRIGIEHTTCTSAACNNGDEITFYRVYFASKKNAIKKSSVIGHCVVPYYFSSKGWVLDEVLFQLVTTAYNEQKRVSVTCEWDVNITTNFYHTYGTKNIKQNVGGIIKTFLLKNM